MSRDDTRFARHECLICGEPLMRIDDIPCCTVCWDKTMRMWLAGGGRKVYKRWQNKGNYVKVIPDRDKAAV
jgi:hypothetical protein